MKIKDIEEKDWSKATDEELMAETKRSYTPGTIFICGAYGGRCTVPAQPAYSSDGRGIDNCGWTFYGGKWSEIVSRSVGCSENSPEPKAGDMVEVFVEVDDEGNKEWIEAVFYAKAFHEGRMWNDCYVVAYKKNGRVDTVTEIRLPQKSEVESKVMELWSRYDDTDATMPDVLTEAIKWGQQNADKK